MNTNTDMVEFKLNVPIDLFQQIEQTARVEHRPFEEMANRLLLEGLDTHLALRELMERTAKLYRARLSAKQKQNSPTEVLNELRALRDQVADELYP